MRIPLFILSVLFGILSLISYSTIGTNASNQTEFSNFWRWKQACDECLENNQQTPLTKKEFINQLNTIIHTNSEALKAAAWITNSRGISQPDQSFFKEKNYQPFVQKVEIDPEDQIAFHGDFHGDIDSFNQFIKFLADKGYMDPHNPFKIIKPNFKIILLGDYTDRGEHGAEVIYTALQLKKHNPDNVVMVRGNHEDLDINAHYGFIRELSAKFKDPELLKHHVDAFYNQLPVALYVKSGANALLCCHGGLEFGFDQTKKLLNAPAHQNHMVIDKVMRATQAQQLAPDFKDCLHKMPQSQIKDYDPRTAPHCGSLGFMWSDFQFQPNNNKQAPILYAAGRNNWNFPQEITKHLLQQASTSNCALRGIFRAHQHNEKTMPRILNQDNRSEPADAGVAKLWVPENQKQPAGTLWDGIVCTFCVSPCNGYGKAFHYNFDSFGILTTAKDFNNWHLAMHRIEVPSPTSDIKLLPKPFGSMERSEWRPLHSAPTEPLLRRTGEIENS